MNRPRGRANLRHGLWEDTPDGLQPGEVRDQPRSRVCSTKRGGCGAAPNQPCTSPSRRPGARRAISGYHQARTTPDPQEPPNEPQKVPHQT